MVSCPRNVGARSASARYGEELSRSNAARRCAAADRQLGGVAPAQPGVRAFRNLRCGRGTPRRCRRMALPSRPLSRVQPSIAHALGGAARLLAAVQAQLPRARTGLRARATRCSGWSSFRCCFHVLDRVDIDIGSTHARPIAGAQWRCGLAARRFVGQRGERAQSRSASLELERRPPSLAELPRASRGWRWGMPNKSTRL